MNEGLGDKLLNEKVVEKPVSEMTAEELRSALAAKEAEEATPAETPDMSYVNMASGEKHEPTPEEREALTSQIEAQETELKENIAELGTTADSADMAESQAKQELETDPNALKPQLTLKRIEEAYNAAKDKINTLSLRFGIATAGLFGATLFGREAASEAYDKASSYDFSNTDFGAVGHTWSNIADTTMYGTGATAVAAAGVFAVGHAINKYRKNRQESKLS